MFLPRSYPKQVFSRRCISDRWASVCANLCPVDPPQLCASLCGCPQVSSSGLNSIQVLPVSTSPVLSLHRYVSQQALLQPSPLCRSYPPQKQPPTRMPPLRGRSHAAVFPKQVYSNPDRVSQLSDSFVHPAMLHADVIQRGRLPCALPRDHPCPRLLHRSAPLQVCSTPLSSH